MFLTMSWEYLTFKVRSIIYRSQHMTSDITLREARQTDLDDMLSIFEETVRTTCKDDYSKEEIRAWIASAEKVEEWRQKLDNEYFLVAHIGEKLVGFGGMNGTDHIDFIFTHFQHGNKGIASLIFDQMQSFAKERGTQKLHSHVSKTGKKFFEQKGFQVTEEQSHALGNVTLTNFAMEKEI